MSALTMNGGPPDPDDEHEANQTVGCIAIMMLVFTGVLLIAVLGR